ncbi:MAG: 2Fe-2S iron-sulfur cluster binding domain-containing protein [Rhizobiales bacterium]|nr:2Fe-2S iron-sulfur cluster binding domain-containing protein [Hyphomicrobiales bacterium]
MTPLRLTVNGEHIAEPVEPRTHLADFLRDSLNLTATHLRCEQGVCGACTILVDGEPVRSCITYAVQYENAEIMTLEGLEHDPVMAALRRAFSAEHALQCGYCTPGMLVTSRDIVLRLPDADEARVRVELSGNLCRCTGYEGIVRAVGRVLAERRAGTLAVSAPQPRRIGPIGSRRAVATASPVPSAPAADRAASGRPAEAETELGLGGRQPNFEIRRSFVAARPPDEVWAFFGQIERVVPCLPGAALVGPADGERIQGRMTVKLGPITTDFSGEARLARDETQRRGTISGAGRDRLSGSRAAADVDYHLVPAEGGMTRVDIVVRALLAGALAQFGRSGIVDDLATRLTDMFAQNLERSLSGPTPEHGAAAPAPFKAGAMLRAVFAARLRSVINRIVGRPHE